MTTSVNNNNLSNWILPVGVGIAVIASENSLVNKVAACALILGSSYVVAKMKEQVEKQEVEMQEMPVSLEPEEFEVNSETLKNETSKNIAQKSVTWGDFKPINNWKVDEDGPKWSCQVSRFIIDETTGRKYSNESPMTVRIKSLLLIAGTPLLHVFFAGPLNVAYRIVKLVTFSHFWMPKEGAKEYCFKPRMLDAGKDFLRIVAAPLAIIGLELAAVYGVIMPYDGRKLYASIERAEYGHFVAAPCFQPEPEKHLFGGDINKRDAF